MTPIQLLSGFAQPHALIGTIALVTFWTAALVKKGTPLHKRVGKVYLLAMIGVVLTAMPLALGYALEGQWVGAAFLGYLVVLVTHAPELSTELCNRFVVLDRGQVVARIDERISTPAAFRERYQAVLSP